MVHRALRVSLSANRNHRMLVPHILPEGKFHGLLQKYLHINLVGRQFRLKIYFTYPITFIWLWNLDTETKECEKTKESRDDIHETHGTTQFIRPENR